MGGTTTSLGFTIWAKNMSKRAFGELQRDLIKTRILSGQANSSFRRFMRNVQYDLRSARAFGLVMTTMVIGPLAAAAGVWTAAAAGIGAVGASIVGMMAIGIQAADKYQQKVDGMKGANKSLKESFNDAYSDFLNDIAPSFMDALQAVKDVIKDIKPIVTDLFQHVGKFSAPIIKAAGSLAEKLLPAFGELLDVVGPFLPTLIDAFKPLGDVLSAVAKSFDNLKGYITPVIDTVLELAEHVLGPDFLGAMGPLLAGLVGFFDNAKGGIITFLDSLAQSLITLGPVLPELGTFLGRVLTAAGPVLESLAESLAEMLPGLLDHLGDFAEFLGSVLEKKGVTDVLVQIGLAFLVIKGALQGIAVTQGVLSILGIGAGAKGAGGVMKSPLVLLLKFLASGPGLIAVGVIGTLAAGIAMFVRYYNNIKDNGVFGGIIKTINESAEFIKKFVGKHGPFASLVNTIQITMIGIITGVKGAWEFLSTNVPIWLGRIGDWFGDLGGWFSRAAKNVGKFFDNVWTNIRRAFNNLKSWFGDLRKNIGGGIQNIITWFRNLGTNIRRTFNNVKTWISERWNSINRILRAAKDWMYENVIKKIKDFFTKTIPDAARTLRDKVRSMWDRLNGILRNAKDWMYENVIKKVKDFFTKTIPDAADKMRRWVGDKWDKVNDRIRDAKDWLYEHVVKKIKDFFTKTIPDAANTMAGKLRDAFDKARKWIGDKWSSVKDVVLAPVNWIIKNVYNNGIRKLWNWIADKVGGKKLDEMSMIGAPGKERKGGKKMKTGGPVHGGPPGRDTVPVWLDNGEHVITREEVMQAGGHQNVMKWRSSLLNGRSVQGQTESRFMKGGGFWDDVKSVPGKLWSKGKDVARGALGAFADPILDKLSSFVKGMPGTPGFNGLLKQLAEKPIDMIRDWIAADDEKFVGDGSLRRSGGGQWKDMFNWIKSRVSGVSLNSAYRPGDPGYHGAGKAVDLGFSDRSEYGPGMHGMALKAFNLIKNNFKPSISELIWDFAKGKAVWNGKDHFFTGGGAGPGTHNDHIHWAMAKAPYGQGVGGVGPLPKGGNAVTRWGPIVRSVLNMLHLNTGNNYNNVLRAIAKESGGNPRAINNWDSNAAAGIPSKGLLQTIDPTFNAYAGKYRSRGVYDPLANIYAAVRYARSRYGPGWSARMAAPGGYKTGTKGAAKGWKLVGENGPEMVNFGGGEEVLTSGKVHSVTSAADGGVTINVYGDVNDERAFQSKVVTAIKDASRKGRMPR